TLPASERDRCSPPMTFVNACCMVITVVSILTPPLSRCNLVIRIHPRGDRFLTRGTFPRPKARFGGPNRFKHAFCFIYGFHIFALRNGIPDDACSALDVCFAVFENNRAN